MFRSHISESIGSSLVSNFVVKVNVTAILSFLADFKVKCLNSIIISKIECLGILVIPRPCGSSVLHHISTLGGVGDSMVVAHTLRDHLDLEVASWVNLRLGLLDWAIVTHVFSCGKIDDEGLWGEGVPEKGLQLWLGLLENLQVM